MEPFATVEDVLLLTGVPYTQTEQDRISALLVNRSDSLRYEAYKYGYNLDEMAETLIGFSAKIKAVVIDQVVRVMRQSMTGDPMSQESQSALGYTWSGTYAIPGGGGIDAVSMKNDLKRLGLLRQRYGMEDMIHGQAKGDTSFADQQTANGD